METLAFVIAAIAVGYCIWKFCAFRRVMAYIAIGLATLSAVGAGWVWLDQQKQDERRRVAATLITPDQINITGAYLDLGLAGGLRAEITNNAPHPLQEVAFKVTVYQCLTGADAVKSDEAKDNPWSKFAGRKCDIIGEQIIRSRVFVPSRQKRAIQEYVSFLNMPQVKKDEWTWNLSVVETVAEH